MHSNITINYMSSGDIHMEEDPKKLRFTKSHKIFGE